jgi:hypothetical protein
MRSARLTPVPNSSGIELLGKGLVLKAILLTATFSLLSSSFGAEDPPKRTPKYSYDDNAPKAKATTPASPGAKGDRKTKDAAKKGGFTGITNLWGVDRPLRKEKEAFGPADNFRISAGQLTFDAEGQEGGKHHSRRPHWPGGTSGVTIGRGYDMKLRTKDEVLADLKKAGVPMKTAEQIAGAAGLAVNDAKEFVEENRHKIEITPRQQRLLFELAYGAAEADVKRIVAKDDVAKKYGAMDWVDLDQAVRDLLVDLRYVGHYTPETREKVQKPAVKNDVAALATLFEDQSWTLNDPHRQKRRADHLRKAGGVKRQAPSPADNGKKGTSCN